MAGRVHHHHVEPDPVDERPLGPALHLEVAGAHGRQARVAERGEAVVVARSSITVSKPGTNAAASPFPSIGAVTVAGSLHQVGSARSITGRPRYESVMRSTPRAGPHPNARRPTLTVPPE